MGIFEEEGIYTHVNKCDGTTVPVEETAVPPAQRRQATEDTNPRVARAQGSGYGGTGEAGPSDAAPHRFSDAYWPVALQQWCEEEELQGTYSADLRRIRWEQEKQQRVIDNARREREEEARQRVDDTRRKLVQEARQKVLQDDTRRIREQEARQKVLQDDTRRIMEQEALRRYDAQRKRDEAHQRALDDIQRVREAEEARQKVKARQLEQAQQGVNRNSSRQTDMLHAERTERAHKARLGGLGIAEANRSPAVWAQLAGMSPGDYLPPAKAPIIVYPPTFRY